MDAWLAALGEIAYAAVTAWGLVGLGLLLVIVVMVVVGWRGLRRGRGE